MSSAFRTFSRASASLARHGPKLTSLAAASRTKARSASANSVQSAGLVESVLRGKLQSFLQNRGEEMVAHIFFLFEPLRRDRDQREGGTGPNVPNRFAEFLCRFELLSRAIRDKAQVHVAVRPCLAARVRAEQINGVERQGLIHRLQTLRQRFTLILQRGRQILQKQIHGRKANPLGP